MMLIFKVRDIHARSLIHHVLHVCMYVCIDMCTCADALSYNPACMHVGGY